MGNIENYKILAKNLVISIVLTLILLFVLSIILSVTSLSESIMGVGIIFISSFSILIGSFLASKKIKEKGIIFRCYVRFSIYDFAILVI